MKLCDGQFAIKLFRVLTIQLNLLAMNECIMYAVLGQAGCIIHANFHGHLKIIGILRETGCRTFQGCSCLCQFTSTSPIIMGVRFFIHSATGAPTTTDSNEKNRWFCLSDLNISSTLLMKAQLRIIILNQTNEPNSPYIYLVNCRVSVNVSFLLSIWYG